MRRIRTFFHLNPITKYYSKTNEQLAKIDLKLVQDHWDICILENSVYISE